ncbi:MAG: LptF/LptG family permease, partial [Elusimicrobiota bacterium]|nr:LptF/LptG family permease [Elusimicrobiota bacterium]
MKILIRYVIKEFLRPVLFCIVIFLILFVLSETFRLLNIENKMPNSLHYGILYLIYEIPYWITQILPIAMLIGFLFFY